MPPSPNSYDNEIDVDEKAAALKEVRDNGDVEQPEEEEEAPPVKDIAVQDADAGEEEEVKVLTQAEEYPPSFFTDDVGNLKFVNLVVRNPCCIFCSIMVLCLGITFALIALVFQDGNPFTEPSNEFDLGDVRSIQFDSLRLAQEMVEEKRAATDNIDAVDKQSQVGDLTYWVFEAQTDEGVFGSAESIEAMKDAFDVFMDDSAFENYCWLDYPNNPNKTVECDVPFTPLSMYFASEWDNEMVGHVIEQLKVPSNVEIFNSLSLCYNRGLYCDLIPKNTSIADVEYVIELGRNITQITNTWDMKGALVSNHSQATEFAAYMLLVDIYKGLVDFGFDKGFGIDNQVSKFSRGIVWWGSPLTDRTELTPDEKEEQDENDENDRKDFIVEHYLKEMNEQASTKTHDTINSYYFMGALIIDVILKIVQQDAMLAIFSLLFVFLWLRVNTGSWFLAGVGIFEIFFSIPVAWFIFTVIFRIKYFATLNALSIFIVAAIGADDIFIFMDAYKQSKYRNPDKLDSLETRMSWVYRRTGTAMAITSATTCSAFLCTLITPLTSIQSFGIFAAVVILIDYILVMTLFCTAIVIYHDRYEDRGCFGCCCTDFSITDPSPTATAKEALESGEQDAKGDAVSEFFRTRVAGFINVPLHRLVLGVIFLSWLGVCVWQTTLIEATKEAEQFLSEDHPLQKSVSILNSEFPTADQDSGLKVYYAWGLGEVDRAGVNLLLDPETYGVPTFVEDFDFNKQCQTELVTLCDKFRTDPQYNGLLKRKSGLGMVYCFVEELAAYGIKGDLEDCKYVRSGDWKQEEWQIDPNDLDGIMDGFLREKSCFDDDGVETISARYSNELGWDGLTMRYAAVSVESEVLNPFSQDAESVTRAEYDQFIAIAEELDQVVSNYCSGNVVMTDLDEKFVFMNNQGIYVRSAIQSAILGVCIAFVVLLISTRVFHIALFASLSIISVLVSVTGTMVMLGWQLGSIESILIGIIAGFSVDYVVHLAHAYETANGSTEERIVEAFGDMGISVLNGMITSVAASIPLFFCQLQFFAKFGTFLCLTIAYSWIFANFGFMSVLAQLKIPLKKGGCRL
jgi:predicted RND superfamily exporter protein